MKKSKYIYLYDSNFLSLLNLIKYLLKKRIIPINIKQKDYEANLFEETLQLDVSLDESVVKEIISASSLEIFQTIFKLFLSTDKNKEIVIYYFLLHGLRYKNKVFYMRNLKSVHSALKISNYVSHEIHKMKGFLRFQELKGNILYSKIAPENNILFYLSEHFKKRLKNEYWIIEDVGRKLVSVYDQKNFYITSSNTFSLLEKELSETEEDVELLWKSFYQTIAIKERINRKCQMNFMPKKYWKYMIEMSDEYEKSS